MRDLGEDEDEKLRIANGWELLGVYVWFVKSRRRTRR